MNKASIFQPRPLALAIAVALGAAPPVSLAAAGRVQFAVGQVAVEDGSGGSIPLKKGQDVDAGDTIVTEKGRVQIKFSDGSFVSLQPQSTFKIDEYKFTQEADGGERSFFSLFRGGLRTITGVIGRRNRDSYRVATPVATIGIRGTEYLIMLDDTGAIVTVGDGAIAVINDAGQVVLVNGQTGHIVDKATLAQLVDEKPVLPPAPPKDLRDEPETNTPQQDEEDLVLGTIDDDGDPEDTLNRLIIIPEEPVRRLESGPGYTVAYAYEETSFGFPVNTRAENADAVFLEGQLTDWTFDSGEGIHSSHIGDLSLVEAGSDEFIGWGRWSNPDGTDRHFTINDNDQEFSQENQSLHYVVGQPTDLAMAAMGRSEAEYDVLSFTTPTERDGTEGQFIDASFLVDFTNSDVSGSVDFAMSGDQYGVGFSNVFDTGGSFSSSAAVSGGGGSCASGGCQGFVSGIVSGPQAERAGFVYHVGDNFNERDMFGAVAFIVAPGSTPP